MHRVGLELKENQYSKFKTTKICCLFKNEEGKCRKEEPTPRITHKQQCL